MVKLLNHMFIPFLFFWRTVTLFAMAVVTFYIPTNSTQSFKFFPILANSFPLPFPSYSLSLHFLLTFLPALFLSLSITHTHSFSLFLSSLLSQRVWSDISLWVWFAFHCLLVTLSIFSYVCYPFVYLLSRNVHSRPLPIFNSYFIFCCSVVELFIYSVCYFFRLPFHSANCAIWCTEVLNFDVIQFISYYFYCLCFWYHIQEIIAKSNVI